MATRDPPNTPLITKLLRLPFSHPLLSLLLLAQTTLRAEHRAKVPGAVARLLFTTTATRVVGTLWALRTLRGLSAWLSRKKLNNWVTDRTWDWSGTREIAVVTGGSGGIGGVIVRDLARKCKAVIVLDLNDMRETKPANVYFLKTDLTQPESISSSVEAIKSRHGNPSILILCAGIGSGRSILNGPLEVVQRTFAVNLTSHWQLVQAFLPHMLATDHGHVLIVASLASFMTIAQNVDYSCTKAGNVSFWEGLIQEIRHRYPVGRGPKSAVRASIVHPNFVRTPLTEGLAESMPTMMTADYAGDEIARVIEGGESRQIALPPRDLFVSTVKAWPTWLQERARDSIQNTVVGAADDPELRRKYLEAAAAKRGE